MLYEQRVGLKKEKAKKKGSADKALIIISQLAVTPGALAGRNTAAEVKYSSICG